jgi:hypothetical protein
VKTVGIEKRRSRGVSSFKSAIAFIRCRVANVRVLQQSLCGRSNVLDVYIMLTSEVGVPEGDV